MDSERAGVLLPEDAAADLPGAFQVRLRGREIAQGVICVADGVPDLRLDPRLLSELAGDAGGRAPSTSSTVTFLLRAFLSGDASASRSMEEVVDRLGDGGFLLRLGLAASARFGPNAPPARWTCRPSPVPRARPAPDPLPPAPCFAARTSAADSRPTAGTPPPAGRSGSRITSAAKSLAVSYRRLRSFSSAFITIQSSSPVHRSVQLPRLGVPVRRDGRQRRRRACSAACSAWAAPPRG